jgi:hypothetical protein
MRAFPESDACREGISHQSARVLPLISRHLFRNPPGSRSEFDLVPVPSRRG